MKRYFLLFIFAGLAVSLSAAGPELSGVFDSTANYTAGAGGAEEHSFGIEEYANLRLRVPTGEKAAFFSALNFIALSGNYLQNAVLLGSMNQTPFLASTPVVYGQNYAAALELERLYFRINGEYVDAEAGLLRLPFGYGQVWGSTDFLNPLNPLFPNARPRGVLGMDFAFYPADSLKLMGFIAAPKDPLESNGGGFLPGLSMDKHWDRASLQALYAYETPMAFDDPLRTDTELGIHRFGLSFKTDLELGLVADALYTLDPSDPSGIEGLSIGVGFDYSFFGGDLFVLMQYLVNGSASSTALGCGGSWANHHYLYGTALYRFNDFCTLSFSLVSCFDDFSFTPFATLEYEAFQGFTLSLTARLPMDQDTMNGGRLGELGPERAGARLIVNAGARLRF